MTGFFNPDGIDASHFNYKQTFNYSNYFDYIFTNSRGNRPEARINIKEVTNE